MITALGCGFVVWFSEGARALDTFDFWVGNFLVFVIATIQIIIFGWVFGLDNGLKEAHRGAAIRIPKFFNGIIKYLCPFFLLTIFGFWLFVDVLGLGSQPIDSHVLDLIGSDTHPVSLVSWVCVGLIISLFFFLSLIAARAPAYKLSTKEKS